MIGDFRALVLTYKAAPVAIREQVSFSETTGKKLMHFLKNYSNATEILVVSTCNRTEIYYCSPLDLSSIIFQGIQHIKNPSPGFDQHFMELRGMDAIRHLFEVAIGLDAQVIGDLQISGQVKNAYQWSADEEMAGPFLHRLLHTIFFANKRVVQETAFRDGAASVSYAAKELAEDLTVGVASPKAVVVGVGEIGQDVCLNLANSRFKEVTILNRTLEKAEKLAEKSGFAFAGMENLMEAVGAADVVICSVAGEGYLINKNDIAAQPILAHKFFIDLSVPRSINPDIEEIPGCILYNLDDLTDRTMETMEKRRSSIPVVNEIIREAIAEFEDWSKEMIVSPTIQRIKQTLEQIRREEVARFLKNAEPEEALKLEEMSKSLVQKILKYPVLQLKAACKRGDAESMAEILQDLFNIDRSAVKK